MGSHSLGRRFVKRLGSRGSGRTGGFCDGIRNLGLYRCSFCFLRDHGISAELRPGQPLWRHDKCVDAGQGRTDGAIGRGLHAGDERDQRNRPERRERSRFVAIQAADKTGPDRCISTITIDRFQTSRRCGRRSEEQRARYAGDQAAGAALLGSHFGHSTRGGVRRVLAADS
jgi:hypothetical protein